MAQATYTIDDYVTTVRKKETIWMVFNKRYNDIHAFHKEFDNQQEYLTTDETDYEAQKEFLEFMNVNLPDIEIVKVFDLVSAEFLIYLHLGSYAIDTDIGSEAYNVLIKKYGDPLKDPLSNKAVLWFIDYENAQKFYEDRKEAMKGEF